jgi:hypothetical protein
MRRQVFHAVSGILVAFVVALFFSCSGNSESPSQKAIRAVQNNPSFSYGRETKLIDSKSCCFVGNSEEDLIELMRMAQANDELSIRQMISGERVRVVSPGSRITILGTGSYSTGINVRFMDGKKGWVGERMIQ